MLIESLNKVSSKVLASLNIETSLDNIIKLDAVILTILVVLFLLIIYFLLNKFLLSKNNTETTSTLSSHDTATVVTPVAGSNNINSTSASQVETETVNKDTPISGTVTQAQSADKVDTVVGTTATGNIPVANTVESVATVEPSIADTTNQATVALESNVTKTA